MKKHVCMVAYTHYLSDARVRREAETLASMPEYDVTVFALRGANGRPESYERDGVQVRELNAGKYRGKSRSRYLLSYIRFTLSALAACASLLRKRSVDVVHVHNMPNFLIFSALWPRIFGKRVILDIHDTEVETYGAKFERRLGKVVPWALRVEELFCCALAHRVICVNDLQREVLIKRRIPAPKLIVSMNVPDPRRFSADGSDTIGRRGTNHRLVYFGTVTKRLGVDLAIEAVASVVRSVADLELHIIGEGDDLGEFVDLSKALGVEHNIRFYERVFPLEELVELVKGTDLGLVPNRRNAATELMLPVKMLECMALGIPVVAPRLKAIQHYFSENSAFYFDPDDVGSLSEVILDALGNEDLRRQKAENARRCLKTYDWETHKLGLLDLYGSLWR